MCLETKLVRTQEGEGYCSPAALPPKIEIKKIVDAMAWNVLRDLPFSRNDPPKWGDD
jgi:hypothetical protein